MRKAIFICVLLVLAMGCKRFPNPFEGERVLAKAGKENLRVMDLEAVFPGGITGADSIAWVESYVDRWVRDQLKLEEAQRLFGRDDADQELIEAYRNSLITRRLEQHLIDRATGDSLYTEAQLRNYYDEHRSDFVLDRTIVKGRVVALPTDFRQRTRLRELFASYSDDAHQEVHALVNKNGFVLREFDQWTEYPQMLAVLPTRRNESYDNLLTRSGIQEMVDGGTTYYFVITEARTAGQTTPYEMVSEIVRGAVSNRRRTEILKAAEDSIYRIALLEKKAVIHL